MLIIDRIRK